MSLNLKPDLKQFINLTFLSLGLVLTVNLVTPAQAMEPISVGSVTAVDLPDSHADSLTLELDTARFGRQSVGKLTLKANNLNLREGQLDQLNLNLKNGQFGDRLKLDNFQVKTEAFQFDAFELLNHQRFILNAPVSGTVALQLTEDNLNGYLGHPKTLDKINKSITKQLGGIQLIRMADPQFTILPQQRLELNVKAVLGESVNIPLRLLGDLVLDNGDIRLDNLDVVSQETPLPIEVAGLIKKELNKSISLKKLSGKKFQLSADELKTRSHQIILNGHAQITALSF